MAWVGTTVTAKVLELLGAPEGLTACVATLAEAQQERPKEIAQIIGQQVTSDLAERSTDVKYPTVSVYCEQVVNQLKEKFRTFSGHASMAIEVRVSQDRLDGIQNQLELYLDAVTQVLDQNRGDWGEGMFYAGGYQASFSAVRRGGQNFIQSATVTFKVGVSD